MIERSRILDAHLPSANLVRARQAHYRATSRLSPVSSAASISRPGGRRSAGARAWQASIDARPAFQSRPAQSRAALTAA